MEKCKTVKGLLNKASLVDYTGVRIDITGRQPIEAVPEHLIESSTRICKAVKKLTGRDIPIEMAYDLWNIHSQENFCSTFANVAGVNDEVIVSNILGVLGAVTPVEFTH